MNIELSNFEKEILDYERKLLDMAVKKSNKNFKFIINFLRKKTRYFKKGRTLENFRNIKRI